MLHCQQAGDFTVVTTALNDSNKENLGSKPRNYQTLSQTIATERLQLLRMVELENAIFTKAFHLIESYYRPTSNSPNTTANLNLKQVVDNVSKEMHHIHAAFPMPRKRIYGLEKSYKAEYLKAMNLPGISKQYSIFHHDLVNWQFIFGAKDFLELNYDLLFDYEDAIATTAKLLAISRAHSDLIDGFVIDNEGKTACSANFGSSGEFCKMVALVEQLIKQKKDRIGQLQQQMDNANTDNSGNFLSGWFKCDNQNLKNPEKLGENRFSDNHQRIKDIQREISAWEELIDVVEIP